MTEIEFSSEDTVENKRQKFLKIFEIGLSFTICIGCQKMPPCRIFNEFFATGIDDINHNEGVIYWSVIRWDEEDYRQLVLFLNEQGYDLEVDKDSDCENYRQWFTRQCS